MPPVGKGVKDLIANALRCDLSKVAIVELTEVHLNFWSDLAPALFADERAVLGKFLKGITQAD